jgi:AAA-like domain
MPNPYVVGRIVKDQQFYNRNELLAELVMFDSTSYLLIGLRRVGKSSVLAQVQQHCTRLTGLAPLLVSLQGLKSAQDFAKAIRVSIKNRIKMSKLPATSDFEHDLGLEDLLRAWTGYCEAQHLQSHLLLDECESIHVLDEKDIADLKALLYEKQGVLKVVLTGSKSFYNDNRDAFNDFSDALKKRILGHFKAEDARDLIHQKKEINNSVTADEQVIEAIRTHCGGHPYLIQWACEKLYNSETKQLSKLKEDTFVADETLNKYFENDFNLLTENQQMILQVLARERTLTNAELLKKLTINQRLLNEANVELVSLGVLHQVGNKFEIAYKLFSNWIEGHKLESPTEYGHEQQKKLNVVTLFATDSVEYLKGLTDNCLNLLQNQQLIQHWDLSQASIGLDVRKEEAQRIAQADIVLGLISPGYFTDDVVKSAHDRVHQLGKKFIPIIAITGYYDGYAEVKDANPLPRDEAKNLPLDSWKNKNQAYAQIAEYLSKNIK